MGGLGQGVDRVIEGVKNLGRKAISAGLSVFGINSPSKVFQEQGYWNAMGLVKGMDDNANRVTKSVSRVGRNAVETMRDEMSTFWDIIDTNFDLSPTISPVLDLSEITKGASTIGNLLSPGSISPDVSIDQASILREEDEGRPTTNEFEQPVSKVYNFEQHIHSPKAISDGEIYRNTRNQFSMAQEVVG